MAESDPNRLLEPLSPEWWLYRLEAELSGRRRGMREMEAYYEGNHPLPFLTEAHAAKMVNEFRRLLDESRSNFCRLVVDACEERLRVEGFRLSASQDETADNDAWLIWQANQMDAEAPAAILDALIKGYSYLSVWGDGETATIAVEDPCETIVSYTPGSNYRLRDAALKVWLDDINGVERANVYLRDAIYKFSARPSEVEYGTAQAQNVSGKQKRRWSPLPGNDASEPNDLGIVPIIPLRNRPRVQREGESELRDVFRIQNQINAFLFLLALAGYFGGHRQRWLTGVPIMKNDKGEPVEPFDADITKIWQSTNPDSKFGDFDVTPLEGYIKAIEQKVLHIAVTTRTPRHYLIEQGQSPSGDAIESAESGLVKKCERKMAPFGEGFEEAIRLARLFQGEEDAPVDSEIVWSDAATPSEAQRTDSVIKKFQAGLITLQQAQADLGYTQTQIQRMAAELAADQLLRSLTAPEAEPVTVPPVGA